MTSAMRMTLAQLRPELREQAKRQIAAAPARLVQPLGPKNDGRRFKHRRRSARAHPIDRLLWQLSVLGFDKPEREYRFHPVRKWRFDAALPPLRIAFEIEGVSTGQGGRHQRIAGYREDARKYNAAQLLGWRVFRFTQDMVERGESSTLLEGLLTTI